MSEQKTVDFRVPAKTWFKIDAEGDEKRRVFRLLKNVDVPKNTKTVETVGVLEIRSEHEVDRLIDGDDIKKPVEFATDIAIQNIKTVKYKYGDGKEGVYVTGPGPEPKSSDGSIFAQWGR